MDRFSGVKSIEFLKEYVDKLLTQDGNVCFSLHFLKYLNINLFIYVCNCCFTSFIEKKKKKMKDS